MSRNREELENSIGYSGGGLSYTQSFTYDSLNRLATAQENSGSSWSQTNAYDRYGNRQIDYGGGNYNLAFSSTSNRITTSGYSYDSSGNLTNDTVHSYGYDAVGKIKSVDSTTAYTYDGTGQRVKKLVGENTRFIYGIGGELVAEFDGSSGNLKKEYVYGTTLITIEPTAVNSNGTQYSTSDHLGTPRVITNSSGSVVARHDYMPFGEELFAGTGGRTTGMGYSGSGDNNRKKFTGYERDSETGLDFAEARYHASTQGRFTSPDPLMSSATPLRPQSWNRYTYVYNNPLKFTDPSGMMGKPEFNDQSYRRHDAGVYAGLESAGGIQTFERVTVELAGQMIAEVTFETTGGVSTPSDAEIRASLGFSEGASPQDNALAQSATIKTENGTIRGEVDRSEVTFNLDQSQTEKVFSGQAFQVNVKLTLPENVATMMPSTTTTEWAPGNSTQEMRSGSQVLLPKDSNFSVAVRRPQLGDVQKANRRPLESGVTFSDVTTAPNSSLRTSTASFSLSARSNSTGANNSFKLKLEGKSDRGGIIRFPSIVIRILPRVP